MAVADTLTIAGATGPLLCRVTGLGLIPGIEGSDGMGEGGVVRWQARPSPS